jgi:preprotein translocase subunit SecF
LRLGIDFTGGTNITLGLKCEKPAGGGSAVCGKPIDVATVRQAVTSKGYDNSVIQLVQGQDLEGISIRTPRLKTEERTQLQDTLVAALKPYGEVDSKKIQIDDVGPAIGNQTLIYGVAALALSFGGIAVYLAFRFQLDYASFAVIALFHDMLVTVGAFAVLGLVAGVEIDSLFIVAMLTICGFSVNDTVVIYDRIRENIKNIGSEYNFYDLVNLSVNQTLARSINTSLTATLPLVAIFLFGGSTLRYFALALIIGFLSGAYSSIFNASILLAWWRGRKLGTEVASAELEN